MKAHFIETTSFKSQIVLTLLNYSIFEKSDFSENDFSLADLSGSSFSNTKFINAKFIGANFSNTIFDVGVDFSNSDLRGANFFHSSIFSDIKFDNAIYDINTILPFSEEKAKELGMVKVSPLNLNQYQRQLLNQSEKERQEAENWVRTRIVQLRRIDD